MRHPLFILGSLVMLLAGCSDGTGGSGGTAPVSCTPTSVSGALTVSGTVRYEDVGYSTIGWNGNNSYKPVRHALIDLLDSCDNILISSATDGWGAFHFDKVTLSAAPVTVRIMAESDPASGNSVAVRTTKGAGYSATYSLASANLATLQNIDISKASGLGGVFNIFDVYQSALEFVASHASAPSLPPLNIHWEKYNTYGTYTCDGYLVNACPQGMGIYVLSTSSDQDEYDDDVLWHEFAHFVEYAISATDSQGGAHTFTNNTLDLRLAWSEGHADYLQTAIKRWLRATHPERLSIPPAPFAVSWYIDTYPKELIDPSPNILVKLDMAAPDISFCGGVDCYIHASNEVAVANALWHGSEQLTESPYWDAFASYLPTVNDGLSGVEDNLRNMESFWDGLLQQLTPLGATENSALSSFSARSINYAADGFEPDDTTGDRASAIDCASVASGACVNENHTLYRGSGIVDLDVVPISVTSGRSYTFGTRPMVNGLDSYLELIGADGVTVLASNDDLQDCGTPACSNNGFNYASGLSYTPAYTGLMYVRVSAVPYYITNTFYRGWGAGRYGGYTLTVTAN